MNFNALIGTASILTAQFLPNYTNFVSSSLIGNFSVSNVNIDNSTSVIQINFLDNIVLGEIISDGGDSSNYFEGDYINNIYTLDNIVGSIGLVPNELSYNFILNFSHSFVDTIDYEIYFSSKDGSLDLTVGSGTLDYLDGDRYGGSLTISDFNEYYNNYDDLYIGYYFTINLPSSINFSTSSFTSSLFYDFGEFDAGDGIDDITVASVNAYILAKNYYNLGLENGVEHPSGFYNIIYDFIENDLLGTSENTYGLATILTQASIILIFISLIMLLVFIFKYCASLL